MHRRLPAQEYLSLDCLGDWRGVDAAVAYACQAWLPASASEQAGNTVIVRSRGGRGLWDGGTMDAKILVPITAG